MTNESHPRWLDWLGGIGVGLTVAVVSHELWLRMGWGCS